MNFTMPGPQHPVAKSIIALSLALAMAGLPAPAFAAQPDPVAPTAEPAADSTQAQPIAAPTPEAQPVPAPVYEPAVEPQPVPPPPAPAPRPYKRNQGLGLVIAGASVFGVSYLASAGAGVLIIDNGKGEVGRPLLIPAVGPFIAIGRVGSATGGLALALAGIAQLTGLGLATGGAVVFARSRQSAKLSFAPGGLQLQF